MAKKIGFYSIRFYARKMCFYIQLFEPVIRKAYPNSTALHLALDAAMLACGALVAEIDVVAPQGV